MAPPDAASAAELAQGLSKAADPDTAGRIAYDLLQALLAGSDVGVLVPLLRSDEDLVLDASAWLMSELGSNAAPLLTELESVLRRGSRKARYWAIDTINSSARAGDSAVIGLALSLVTDGDPVIREKAADFMSRASDEQMYAARQSTAMSASMHELIRWFLHFREHLTPEAVHDSLGSAQVSYRLAAAAAAIRSGVRRNIEVLLDSDDESVTALAERELAMPRWQGGKR